MLSSGPTGERAVLVDPVIRDWDTGKRIQSFFSIRNDLGRDQIYERRLVLFSLDLAGMFGVTLLCSQAVREHLRLAWVSRG